LSGFVSAFAMFVLAVGAVAGLRLLARFTAVTPVIVVGPFLAGGQATEHAASRFHARWYLVCLLFLPFDIEMLFMYPWAVVVADVGLKAVVEMFVFLVVLLAGVVHAWRERALEWA